MVLLAACGGAAADYDRGIGGDHHHHHDHRGSRRDTDDTTNETVDLADMPQECIDAFVGFLQAIEPVVAGLRFRRMPRWTTWRPWARSWKRSAQHRPPRWRASIARTSAGTDEEAFAAMIDIAEREAPGTVALFPSGSRASPDSLGAKAAD